MGALRPAPRDALRAAAVVGVVNAALWSMLVVAVRVSWDADDVNTVAQEAAIGVITLVGGVLLVAVCLVGELPSRRRSIRLIAVLALSVVFAAVRTVVDQRVLPLASDTHSELLVLGINTLAYLMVASPAILVSALVARRQAEQEAREAVEADEADLRREVSEHLHGAVQNRLVLVGAGLDQLAAESDREGRPERADALRAWAQMVDTVREQDVRVISHQVFPTGLDLGLAQALGLLLDRLPTSVATSFHLGDGVRELDQALPIADRLVVAAVIEEGLTNALKHGHATRISLDLAVEDHALVAVLDDDGVGLPAGGTTESGLLRQRARLEPRGGRIVLGDGPSGTRLRVVLPIA